MKRLNEDLYCFQSDLFQDRKFFCSICDKRTLFLFQKLTRRDIISSDLSIPLTWVFVYKCGKCKKKRFELNDNIGEVEK